MGKRERPGARKPLAYYPGLRGRWNEQHMRLCAFCGRAVYTDEITTPEDELQDWLIAPIIRGPYTGVYMVRCPQHITTYALKRCGIWLSANIVRWMHEAKERDEVRLQYLPDPRIVPVSFKGESWSHE